jgi:hypothetical protein
VRSCIDRSLARAQPVSSLANMTDMSVDVSMMSPLLQKRSVVRHVDATPGQGGALAPGGAATVSPSSSITASLARTESQREILNAAARLAEQDAALQPQQPAPHSSQAPPRAVVAPSTRGSRPPSEASSSAGAPPSRQAPASSQVPPPSPKQQRVQHAAGASPRGSPRVVPPSPLSRAAQPSQVAAYAEYAVVAEAMPAPGPESAATAAALQRRASQERVPSSPLSSGDAASVQLHLERARTERDELADVLERVRARVRTHARTSERRPNGACRDSTARCWPMCSASVTRCSRRRRSCTSS